MGIIGREFGNLDGTASLTTTIVGKNGIGKTRIDTCTGRKSR
jgi:hypothetical protein